MSLFAEVDGAAVGLALALLAGCGIAIICAVISENQKRAVIARIKARGAIVVRIGGWQCPKCREWTEWYPQSESKDEGWCSRCGQAVHFSEEQEPA